MEMWMIVYLLPLEVWMDIFCYPWISREKFGQLVDKIGNWKFAEHAQFYLHEWGKRKLGKVYFVDNEHNLRAYVGSKPLLDLPQAALPENIKTFDYILIQHFDANTINFLNQIGVLLLTDIEIDLCNITPQWLDPLRTILTRLAPSLDGIHSLAINQCTLPLAKQHYDEKFNKLKVLKYWSIDGAKVAEAVVQENLNTIVDWLTQSSADGPRLLDARVRLNDIAFCKQIFKAIREQFLLAKTPSTFAMNVLLRCFFYELEFDEFHLVNDIGEELHGVGFLQFQVTRHPAKCETRKVQRWIQENLMEQNRGCIQIVEPTIGAIDAAIAQMDGLHLTEEQAAEQKPCSSKDV